jgi:hypothetical protein
MKVHYNVSVGSKVEANIPVNIRSCSYLETRFTPTKDT